MPITALRKRVNLILAISAAIIIASYAYSGYLLYRRNQVVEFSAIAGPQPLPRAAELVADADRDLKAGRVEQGLVKYREALSLDPQLLAAQAGLANGEFQAGREEVTLHEYGRVLQLDPTNKVALLQIAHIDSHNAREWPQSEAKYREYLRVVPNDAAAMLGLARVLAWQGKPQGAAELFGRNGVRTLMTTGDERDYAFALVKLGRYGEAEPLLRRLLGARPDDLELKLQLASLYASRKEWNSSLAIYRSLLARRPDDSRLNMNYGFELMAIRDYQAAVSPLEKARNAMPSNSEVALAYARALKESGKLKPAVREYDRVIPSFEHNAPVLREYADALLEKRDYRKSAQYYNAAYGLGLQDDRLLLGLTGALSGQGKYREALPYLEDLHRRAPTPRVTFELAKVMMKLGHYREARQLLQQVEDSDLRAVAQH